MYSTDDSNNRALEEALLRFDAIYNSIALGIGIGIHDKSGVLVGCNAELLTMFGIEDKQEWMNSRVCFENDPNFPPDLIRHLRFGIGESYVIDYDFDKVSESGCYKTVNKGCRVFETRNSNLMNSNGAHIGNVFISTDITDKSLQELELNNGRKSLDMVLAASKVLAWDYNIHTNKSRILYGERSNEYTEGEMIDVIGIHPDDVSRYKDLAIRVSSGEMDKDALEIRMKDENGIYRYCESFIANSRNEEGKITHLIGSIIDISERREREKKERELKSALEIVMNAGDVSVWKYTIAERKFHAMLGKILMPDGTTYEECAAAIAEDDRDNYHQVFKRLLHGESDKEHTTFHFVIPETGADRYYRNELAVLFDDHGKRTGIIGTQKDITVDIIQKRRLEEFEIKTKLTNEKNHIIQWDYDITKQCIITNGNGAIREGVEMDKDAYLSYIHPDDRHLAAASLDQMSLSEQGNFDTVLRTRLPGYEDYRHVIISSLALRDKNGDIVGYTGIRRDATEEVLQRRELAEKTSDLELMNEQIRESKLKTDMAIKNAKMVMWEYVVEERMFTAFNDPLTNYDVTAKYSPDEYVAVLDPHSVEEARQAIAFMDRQEVGEFSFKSKIMLPNSVDWQYITIYGSHSEVRADDSSKASKYIGFRVDNTQVVELSHGMEESNALTSSILAQSPSAIFIKDITDNWRYIIANDLFCQLFNYTEEQIIGYTDHEIFSKDVADRFHADDLKAADYDDIYSFVEEIVTDGKVKALHTTKRVIAIGNGRQLLIGITSDITQTLAQQMALEEANEKTELVLNNANAGLVYIDNDFRIVWENSDSVANVPHIEKYKRGCICYNSVHGLNEPCPDCVILRARQSLSTEKQTKVFDDGTVLDIYATPVVGKDKQINGYVCRLDDVTKDVLKTRQLEEIQKYLDLAIEAGNVAVWGYNPKQDTVFNISGRVFDEDELPLYKAMDYVHPDDVPAFTDAWTEIISGRSDKEAMCMRFHNPFLNKFEYVDKSIIALRKPSGELDMIIGTHHDVTEDKMQKLALEDSNQKLNMALDVIQAFSWHCDLRDGLLLFDTNFISLGCDAESMNSMYKFAQHIHIDDRQTFLDIIIDFMCKDSGEFISTYRIDLRGNGVYEWWECRGKMRIMEENGQRYKYAYGMDCNITRHKHITDELQKSKDSAEEASTLLHSIIKQIPFGLYIKDIGSNFKYLIMNDILAVIDGVDSKYAISKSDFDLFDKKVADMFYQENIKASSRPDGELTVVKHVIDWHGQTCVYENSDTVITVANGRRLLVGVVADVTDKERMLSEIKDAKERAEQSDKLKSAFLANMSHEIRTPLNAIVGFSELLIGAESIEEREEYTNIIAENNELLLRLIGDILDLSKIESGMIELKAEEFDISDICDEVYTMLKQKVTNPNVAFTVDNPYRSCVVELDKNRLKQVGINLITNAIKYTAHGTIKMGYKYVDKGIKIYVEDTGIGIGEENHNKVFMRFEKFDSFAQGTGLGLSICKAIIDAQGGRIGFESKKGVGSIFWAWFPCDAQIKEIDSHSNHQTLCKEENRSVELTTDLIHFNILVAEDNDSNFLLVKHLLKGYTLIRACNGVEAVEKAKAGGFDMILMDWKMPLMNGLEATQAIRAFDQKTPIIAVTANAFDSDKLIIMGVGCNAFVAKPLKKRELLDTIAAFR